MTADYDAKLRLAAREAAALLGAAGLRLGVAESCTGGLIAAELTRLPGSSAWFEAALVCYSNVAKQGLLGVPEALLIAHGAVSEPVVAWMASAVRERLAVDVGIAVSGVAGPGGGSVAKPLGTVCLGVALVSGCETATCLLPGGRDAVRAAAGVRVLRMLAERLGGAPEPASRGEDFDTES